MTAERIKKLLPIFQAIAEGKKVQWRNYGIENPWVDNNPESPMPFDNENPEWRVKPEPRDIWLVLRKDRPASSSFLRQDEGIYFCEQRGIPEGFEQKHFREVVD